LEWALAGYRGPGNMIGSGFYRSPAAVAPYGNLAILIWLVMGAGVILMAIAAVAESYLTPTIQ